MDLSNDLISKFVKITNDADKQKPKEGTVYGTAVKYDGGIYVKIDGSDLLTPVDTTADIQDGERVTITIKDHNATVTGNITSPSANEGTVTKKVTEAVDGIEDKVITEVEILVADRVSTKELDAEVARIDELIAGKATIEDLEATNAKIDNLDVGDLNAINAEIENLKANKAEIGDLTATNATIGILDAKVANIDTLVNGNLTSDNILSFNITSKNTTMEDAFIKDAMIDRITANKIMSGTIDTNNVVIQSTDGSMLLQGNILQMKDESGKVRIQIGKDTGGNFTFVLYDETGKGVLIDEEGIKSSDAIADGLIVDAKVADNANISGSKLDIASVITEVNEDNSTTIKSSKIYLNEQNQSLEVAFNSLKSQVETIQDITINGDLSSIVEQVQSNTTKIEANKEGINTLVAENVIRTEEISDLEGELQQVNTTLSNKYASLEQNINGFKTTVSDTYTTKTEFDNLEVGGRNLLLSSKIEATNNDYGVMSCRPTELFEVGETYTVSICVTPAKGVSHIYTFVSNGYAIIGEALNVNGTDKQVISTTFTFNGYASGRVPTDTSDNNAMVTFFRYPEDGTVTSNTTIHWAKVEKGAKATDWTPAPEDVQANIDAVDGKFANYSTTTQMNSAIQQKANEITSSVSSTYTTKAEFNANLTTYATKSELTQTNDSIIAKFSESGGYNYLYNGNFKNGTTHWTVYGDAQFTLSDMWSPSGRGVYTSPGIGKISYIEQITTLDPTVRDYTVSCMMVTSSSGTDGTNPMRNLYVECFYEDGSVTYHTIDSSAFDMWEKRSITITKPGSTRFKTIKVYGYVRDTSKTAYFADFMVEKGVIANPWSPHPNEIHDGITQIDKDGIKVSQSNYNGYTRMKADGFYVNNGSENVISITKDGSYFKGKVVITSGSTVPTSVLSGTVSSAQLDSGITSDISTAKSNASTAVSTANTASTNASNAVKTANTASTNASTAVSTANTAKSTADSVKSTVDSGKINWNNAYNRVNEWAYEAVTGSTTIDGGYIQTNTIVSDKIAAGAIIAAKIAAGAVTADKISAGAITADKLAANAITSKTITGSTITGGTISGATITSETLMKTYGGMYVGSEIWGGFAKNSSGTYESINQFNIKASKNLFLQGNNVYIYPSTGEVKIGDTSSYDNLRARCLYAQETVYTDDIRARTTGAALLMENISMRATNAYIQFTSGLGIVRVKERNHLYLQTGGNTGGDTSAEIRCTRYTDVSNYVNIRAHNVCAQNAVYANGVNVSSDINRKRDIELYSTDALQEVCSTPVYAYHLDTDKDEELKRIGIIMQEAPLDAIDLTGKGVDLYQMVTMLWRAVQQQQEIINELKGE